MTNLKKAEAKKIGERLGREGLAKMALNIMQEAVADGSYKKAIEAAGMLSVVSECCCFDDYWKEKSNIGIARQINRMR